MLKKIGVEPWKYLFQLNRKHFGSLIKWFMYSVFQEKPFEAGLKILPVFYGLTMAINAFSIFYNGSHRKCKASIEMRSSGKSFKYTLSRNDQSDLSLYKSRFRDTTIYVFIYWIAGKSCFSNTYMLGGPDLLINPFPKWFRLIPKHYEII